MAVAVGAAAILSQPAGTAPTAPATAAASGAELAEMPVLASKNGVLDLLMVARAAPADALTENGKTANAWVFDVCARPASGSLTCPANANPYGGVRLALKAGDVMKVRLVNRLPAVAAADAAHSTEPGHSYLTTNPVNLHTHGLMVSAHYPTSADQTYGDNVFVMTLNPANLGPGGALPADSVPHGDVRPDYTDYRIEVPKSHPSGLFWFHPHIHGLSLNQLSAGMAGIITVGDPTDYQCTTTACKTFTSKLKVRHLLLRDAQVLADGTLQTQEDPGFCDPLPSPTEAPRNGHCAGADTTAASGPNYTGGNWVFSLNGQRFPTITLGSQGEVWRLVNASGSVSYELALTDRTNNRDLVMQVMAVDGVAVSVPTTVTATDTATIAGKKFHMVTCPTDIAAHKKAGDPVPLCADSLIMMPSSRVEVYVAYRDATGKLATPAAGTNVVLRTKGRDMGPAGDIWPTIDLAKVDVSKYALGTDPWQTIPSVLDDPSMAKLSAALFTNNQKEGYVPACKPLAPGHRRRIFFNTPPNDPDGFGLGYEEVDAQGKPVPGTFKDVARYNPMDPDKSKPENGICIPLGPNNGITHERWEIINLAGEDHNFHIHQLKFSVVGTNNVSGGTLPTAAVQHDNVPLQHTTGACDTVDDWRIGKCTAYPVVVDIPFIVAGDYVYHCHILEHEDGGMMARVFVRPSV